MTKSRGIIKHRHVWTAVQVAELRLLYPDLRGADVASRLGISLQNVYRKVAALGLQKSAAFRASDLSGRIQRGRTHPAMVATQFAKGLVPWNNGLHYVAGGRSAETRFKPGQRPHTWLPIGSYRISADGALERKVNDLPGGNHVRWHPVTRLVWQAVHGPVPKGHMVVFKPGLRTTVLEQITLDKIECISRQENARRNHPNSHNPELAKLVQLKGAITRQVNRIAKESAERKSA